MPIGISFSVIHSRATPFYEKESMVRFFLSPLYFAETAVCLRRTLQIAFFSLCRFVESGLDCYKSEMNCMVSSLLVDQSVTKRTGVRVPPRLPQSSKLTCCFNSSILSFGM